MFKIVRFIAFATVLVSIVTGLFGCNVFKPSVDRFYGGAIINDGPYNVWVRCVNPPPEHGPGTKDDYTQLRELPADGGTQSYWLHQRIEGREPGYRFEVYGQSQTKVDEFDVFPNGIMDDAPYEARLAGLDWWRAWPSGQRSYQAAGVRGGDR